MIGSGLPGYIYDQATVAAVAPRMSGVYGICNAGTWIYVGEADDIRRRMLEHVGGDNWRIAQEVPTVWAYEEMGAFARMVRQQNLITALDPVANVQLTTSLADLMLPVPPRR